MELSARKLAILYEIAKSYLKTGEPVGSKLLAFELGGISSATIRNEMAELERLGLLSQPHTSAGRVPTVAGLKLYVNTLMKKRSLSKSHKDFIDSLFCDIHSVEGAVSAASSALADYSKCASFSTVPSGENLKIKKIEIIKSGADTLVFVILTNTNIVKSSFVHLDAFVSDEAFCELCSFVDENLNSTALADITPPFVQTLAAKFSRYSLLFSPFFHALAKTASELLSSSVKVNGQNNLLSGELSYTDRAKALQMLHSDKILSLLSPDVSGTKIMLSDELNLFDNTALIYSNYKFSNDLSGQIGILGPSRLDYETLIPLIEYFSLSLEKMLKTSNLDK